jgi:hypothetical protein
MNNHSVITWLLSFTLIVLLLNALCPELSVEKLFLAGSAGATTANLVGSKLNGSKENNRVPKSPK